MNKIYKLVYNGVVVYVGKTKLTLNQRKRNRYRKNPAVQAIYKDCDIELIEETSDVSRERYWIEQYKDTLLNIEKGDTGLSEKEYKKKYLKEYYRKRGREYMREYRLKNKLKNGITNI